jgi:hypothetical protein
MTRAIKKTADRLERRRKTARLVVLKPPYAIGK